MGDVGKSFGGVELMMDEYERVEALYVSAAQRFMAAANVQAVEVRNVNFGHPSYKEGHLATGEHVGVVVQAMLREELDCQLESPGDDFYIHVGFDFYMYVGSAQPCDAAARAAQEDGLFVEPDWPSPQLPELP